MKIVRVSATEFETEDGKVFPHPIPFQDGKTPSVKEFQSHWVEVEWVEDVLGKSYEEELVEDMLSLMSSFSARIYGKRSAENRRKKKGKERAA